MSLIGNDKMLSPQLKIALRERQPLGVDLLQEAYESSIRDPEDESLLCIFSLVQGRNAVNLSAQQKCTVLERMKTLTERVLSEVDHIMLLQCIAKVLGEQQGEIFSEFILSSSRSQVSSIRHAAILSLQYRAELGEQNALTRLEEMARSADPENAKYAIKAMERLKESQR